MIHKRRENRRYLRNKKIQKRLNLMKELGERGGSLFEKHLKKIHENGGGYMSKHGNCTHYINSSSRKIKTRGNDYGISENWDRNSRRQIDSMNDQMKDYDCNL